MKTNTIVTVIIGIILFLLGVLTIIPFITPKKTPPKVVVREVTTVPVGGWPDYGFNTWRRGGRPWGKRGRHRRPRRHHMWKRGGGARKSRPIA